MPDLQQWRTKEEVCERLNISDRGVDRLVQRKKLRKRERKVYGRRPVPIYHPSDVEKLAGQSDVTGSDWQPVDTDPTAEPVSDSLPQIANGEYSPQTDAIAGELLQFLKTIRDNFVAAVGPPLQIASAANAGPPVPTTLYLTMSEACLYSGLPESRLRAFIRDGRLTRIPGARNRTMISRGELENLWRNGLQAKGAAV